MVTITLTYRDKDIGLLKNCLESLKNQNNKGFLVTLVDYGSTKAFKHDLNELVKYYDFVALISCNVEHQLWCKSRAINIALKACKTPYFFVGDVDMVFHPNFIDTLQSFKKDNIITYFQAGFLNKEESSQAKGFQDYNINFKSTHEATGMTLYPTEILKSINGYDEFYHGWGSEDTDVHVRLRNAGFTINFYNTEVLVLHQWHQKTYRGLNNVAPFHTGLEKINQDYLKLSEKQGKTKANVDNQWGMYSELEYQELDTPMQTFSLTNKESLLKAFIINVLLTATDVVVKVDIKKDVASSSLKYRIKNALGKKTTKYMPMEDVNDLLLECVVSHLKTNPYRYIYRAESATINLTIKL